MTLTKQTSKKRQPKRRPGSRWRLLVHDIGHGKGAMNGTAHYIGNLPEYATPKASKYAETLHLPDSEFDELVVGRWLHVEQMDALRYWMNVGGVTVWVTADRDGNPKRVSVTAAGDYNDKRPGCVYEYLGVSS